MSKIAPWNDPNLRWVCENHPTKDHEHKRFFFFECGGAGMPEPHETKGHRCSVGCSSYSSGHSVDANGNCNLGCC